ncbi:complex I NDUFA9 subunit family protein [Afifella marina]|uniref:NADH dehydrogenase n=1 Tax=Afifella marina DSM 2698 TaxID=1120955 RepID=A0A1G5NVH0_AFIMA|nr:complex I NDUFA9 subunit family protein [Afifella marina]MBK1624032.1 complex I NDUFA9 subunit family protein [Afifella marina DSM 2698]MBK1627589.1 complex I NDUFA9 subunit family protein [Afifella marina]MBK5916313.1 hypothetical protein [Afifella marina]RAI20883.1 hypothetical protein CH311_08040 [Afifella marina DSM 2698]SCZ41325.1 NADH dehydrogenase [Afifella marina DSM 2698]
MPEDGTFAGKEAPVVVFGGGGFLGHRICRRLLEKGRSVRAVSRHPNKITDLLGRPPGLAAVEGDIERPEDVARLVEGAGAVVNAVSLYVERGGKTFRNIHVEAAGQLAALAHRHGVPLLVQLSGVGADPNSPSRYIAARGAGEVAVRRAFGNAVIVRPAVMFGPQDGFICTFSDLLRRYPVFPLFGSGETRLQPTFVGDVAEAVACIVVAGPDPEPRTYEFGGPRTYTYRELVGIVADEVGVRRLLIPLPIGIWKGLAAAAERLPKPPVTSTEVELMEAPNVATEEPGFAAWGVTPTSVEDFLREREDRKAAQARHSVE